jgi:transformation/transcription domain-associated protein
MDKMRTLSEASTKVRPRISEPSSTTKITQRTQESQQALRVETFAAIQERWVPNTIALNYFQQIYPSFADFWLFRRQFSYQYAALTFMSYVMFMSNRYPSKISISRSTGDIWGSELIPTMAGQKAIFHNPEPVPFRLTPNLQILMGPLAMEGIFACAVMAIARCLTEPEHELEQQLSIFVRDEMTYWFSQGHRAGLQETQLREMVYANTGFIVKRAITVAQPPEGNLPANQTLIDLISRAVDPAKLAQSDALWMPYL